MRMLLFSLILVSVAACTSPEKLERALVYPQYVTKLKLNRAGLDSLPDDIGKLQNLERFVLSLNHIKTLPAGIGQLKKLTYLSLQNNDLESLPSEIGGLENLRILDLSHNRIRTLPPEIGKLKNLRTLYLHFNDLEHLPPEIGLLENLEILTLNNNSISDNFIPSEIGNLQNLIELNLVQAGPMLNLPESMSGMKSLQILYVDNSAVVPVSIRRLSPPLKVAVVQN